MFILYKLVQQIKKVIQNATDVERQTFEISGGGCFFHILKNLLKLIDRPWKMYPLGVFFGLGLDTSSEVALLEIASIQGAHGTSIWLILIFPVLFTAEMCLLDAMNGSLMMTLYTNTTFASDLVAVTYYSIVLTVITICAAVVIGFIQVLNLVQNTAQPSGKFWVCTFLNYYCKLVQRLSICLP